MGDDERPSESRRASQESTEVETEACGNLRTWQWDTHCAWLNNCSCELMYIPKKFMDVAHQKLAPLRPISPFALR
jgi:hypothetical protein